MPLIDEAQSELQKEMRISAPSVETLAIIDLQDI
jgi:hypothetical protein